LSGLCTLASGKTGNWRTLKLLASTLADSLELQMPLAQFAETDASLGPVGVIYAVVQYLLEAASTSCYFLRDLSAGRLNAVHRSHHSPFIEVAAGQARVLPANKNKQALEGISWLFCFWGGQVLFWSSRPYSSISQIYGKSPHTAADVPRAGLNAVV